MGDPSNTSNEKIISELIIEDESFEDIVIQFVEGLSDRVKTMEDALRSSDFEALRVAAHQLKGSGGGYGYPILTEMATVLEEQAKNQSMDECQQEFEKLKEVCTRVVVSDLS